MWIVVEIGGRWRRAAGAASFLLGHRTCCLTLVYLADRGNIENISNPNCVAIGDGYGTFKSEEFLSV